MYFLPYQNAAAEPIELKFWEKILHGMQIALGSKKWNRKQRFDVLD